MSVSELVALTGHLKPTLLRGLDAQDLRIVLKGAEFKSFPAGSIMLRQGYPANKLLLLVEGQACYTFSTSDGRRLVLHWTNSGKVLGLATLLPEAREYFVNTEAVEDCDVLAWNRTTIRHLANRYPCIWENAFETLTLGLGVFIDVYASRTGDTAPQRLARALFELADVLGERNGNGIEVNVRNEDLAQAANVTSFTASRLLNQWQRKGWIVKTRRKIVLRSPQTLLRLEV
jgi:CRP-like cAMP-binding protein